MSERSGILLLPGTFETATLSRLRAGPVPVAAIMETAVPFPGIRLQAFEAARELTLGLRKRGGKRVGVLSGHGGFFDQEKWRGIRDASDIGRNAEELMPATTDYRPESVGPILDKWFASSKHPDAIIAFDDTLALAAIRGLEERDIPAGSVPVAGFNDMPFAALTSPSLTSVAFPVEEAAYAATRTLTHMMDSGTEGRSQRLPYAIHWRGSTGDGI